MAVQVALSSPDLLLMEVLVAARRLLAMQSRMNAVVVPESLADAIERDFLLFDLHEAAQELHDAVEIAETVTLSTATRG